MNNQRFEKSIFVQATPATVWEALTSTESMQEWMGEPEMELEVMTDWNVGSPIIIRGSHNGGFENKGRVLQFDPCQTLVYSYLSSISELPDEPEHYTVIHFDLIPCENGTSLTLRCKNFPTESIFHHVRFYWNTTLEILKRWIEESQQPEVRSGKKF